MKFILAPAFALAVTFAAVPADAAATAATETVRPLEFAGLGQAMRVAPDVTVRADRVLEDSRCPAMAQCIQAGRLVIAASIQEQGTTRSVTMTLGVPVLALGGAVRLDHASHATSRRPGQLPTTPYRFHFVHVAPLAAR